MLGVPDELSNPTGRYVVVLADNVLGDEAASAAALLSVAGISNVASAADVDDGAFDMEQADALLFPKLGVAMVAGEPNRLASLTAAVGGDERIEANSTSIMAVGAVDNQLRIANFSPRSNPVAGGEIDIVGPGVDVYSSWPAASPNRRLSGTSVAAAHVAGIAALLAQATGATGAALWGQLVRAAQRLPIPAVDAGAGLVQAPQF